MQQVDGSCNENILQGIRAKINPVISKPKIRNDVEVQICLS